MTSNRDVAIDQAATSALLDADLARQQASAAERPNWLGHSRTNADVDAALLAGATDFQLRALRNSWRNHKNHLLEEHGLFVANHGGLYRFAGIELPEPTEAAPQLDSETDHLDNRNALITPTGSKRAERAADVDDRRRFHGFVVLPRQAGGPAAAMVHREVPSALALLNETLERTIFAITGSDEDAVAAAATAVKQVWNRWANGNLATAGPTDPAAFASFVRNHGDWTPSQPIRGSFYVYEYRKDSDVVFYVGKGTNGRYLAHVKDVSRMMAESLPPTAYSPKERTIANELTERGGEQLVRIVAEFEGPHAELCAFVVERFLIGMVYGPFSLTNNNLGQAHFDKRQCSMRWLCQPRPVRQNPDYVPLWISAATRLIEQGEAGQVREADLTWMRVQPYVQPIRGQFTELEETRLDFIGAGNNGKEVSIEWNVRGAPVRIQLVFSRHNTTVHFNLRPRAPSWRSSPTAAAHQAYNAFIDARFGHAPQGRTLVKMPDARDCFFKPFGGGKADASFDYTDPTSMVLTNTLQPGEAAPELNFQGAMDYLLAALPQPLHVT